MRPALHNLALLRVLSWTDFKLRYHGSVLGYVWALLKPLLIFCVLYVVFQFLFGSQVQFYALRLLTGIILWSFFSEATMAGMQSLMQRANLLTKLQLPRWIIPLASIATSALSLVINLGVLAIFFIANGKIPSLAACAVALLLVFFLFMMVIGFALGTSVLLPRFRDLNQIWEVLLNALMYATPIIYPLVAIPATYRNWFYLNPLTPFFEHIRAALIDNVLPDALTLAPLAVTAVLTLALGIVLFVFLQRRIAEDL